MRRNASVPLPEPPIASASTSRRTTSSQPVAASRVSPSCGTTRWYGASSRITVLPSRGPPKNRHARLGIRHLVDRGEHFLGGDAVDRHRVALEAVLALLLLGRRIEEVEADQAVMLTGVAQQASAFPLNDEQALDVPTVARDLLGGDVGPLVHDLLGAFDGDAAVRHRAGSPGPRGGRRWA